MWLCTPVIPAFGGKAKSDVGFLTVSCEYFFITVKKLLWPMAGQNIERQEIQAEIEEERRRSQADTM